MSHNGFEELERKLHALYACFDGQTVCPLQLVGRPRGLQAWSQDALAALVGGTPLPDPMNYLDDDEVT
jgi:hypothetical protein